MLLILFQVSCHAEAFGFGVDRSDVVQLAAAACDNGNGGGGGGASRLVWGQLTQFLISLSSGNMVSGYMVFLALFRLFGLWKTFSLI